jgi:hypothetical protein
MTVATQPKLTTLDPSTPRWWRFVKRRRIVCPALHHIPNTFEVTEAGFVRCAHWIKEERRECNRWVFLYAVRGGGIVVAEVTLHEKDAMEREHLTTPSEMIDYLGIFPD